MSLCFKEISYPCSLFHTKASIVDIHDTSFQFMLRLFLKDSTACLQKWTIFLLWKYLIRHGLAAMIEVSLMAKIVMDKIILLNDSNVTIHTTILIHSL